MTKNTKTQTNETVPPAGAGIPDTDPRNDFHADTLGGSGFGTGSDHLRALRDIVIASIAFLLKRPKADFDKASQAQTPTRVIGVSGYVVPARQWDDPDQPKEKTGVFLADAAEHRDAGQSKDTRPLQDDIPERLRPVADFGWPNGIPPHDLSDEEIESLLKIRDWLDQHKAELRLKDSLRRASTGPLHLAYNP